jgi:hypothetical protein
MNGRTTIDSRLDLVLLSLNGRTSIASQDVEHGEVMSHVESSRSMPRVPSTSVHLSVPAYLVDQVQDWADNHGLARAEAIELLLSASLAGEDTPAVQLQRAYEAGEVQTPAEVSAALDAAGVDVPVIGLLLGPRQPVRGPEPFHRDHLGADLSDDALSVWPSVRGVWRVSDRPRIVAAFRIGRPLGVYRIAGWEQVPGTPRRWATGGQVISGDRRLDADTGHDMGETTPTDRAITAAVFANPLAVSSTSANPLVWLHRR